ncbi:cation diffusion facilitator family transporter [Myxococcus xanthus]|jgi:Co/Zn/Cd efflux system component|uniref:Cation diffusion facilitator family transporter n=1 Tax=Myxococcus xanthus TaxID=34 RepID=A0A7Y4IJR4_MYXXA|nr:cation diffusion facilitator family transporter [Myxococcus xanthus]NOJ80389.1 cation diffusion facilitator family transporter [Myxococcus xanthus]NOJ84922.1 cation diffusion facilitator family transporter [Myxococcus xanthus]
MKSDNNPSDITDRSEFKVPRMDCPSEERTVRMALEGLPMVRALTFNLPERRLTVWHARDTASEVAGRLEPLGLGAQLVETHRGAAADEGLPEAGDDPGTEARTLWVLLTINGIMFVAELVAGWLVQSTGLIADSLDMLADAMVYGLSLYAVGRAATHKLRAAHLSGYLQIALALGALFEVGRRFLFGSEPEPNWMLGVATLALAANVTCLLLISRHRKGGAHMKASYIFSTNDVLANLGVIAAGILVALTKSPYPDLLVGLGIAVLVLSGAVRILRLRA